MEDGLLGIGNRRAMEVDLEHTHAVALRYKHPYTVVLFDIDHFKLYNDHYGHLEGDACLKQVSQTLEEAIRKSDRLYRYGGEEFLLILPNTKHSGALILAKRLVENLYNEAIPHCKSPHNVVTISAGIASYSASNGNNISWKNVVEQADKSLYQAKSCGRNQVA
jgi:diguanylate cyclase (GGDEF)-like protein